MVAENSQSRETVPVDHQDDSCDNEKHQIITGGTGEGTRHLHFSIYCRGDSPSFILFRDPPHLSSHTQGSSDITIRSLLIKLQWHV